MKNSQFTDFIVTLDHPYGVVEIKLNEWMILGPGPRFLLKPRSLKSIETKKRVSLNKIPLKYRNTFLSRLLIKLHLIPNPWNR